MTLTLDALIIHGDTKESMITWVVKQLQDMDKTPNEIESYLTEVEEGVSYNHVVYVSRKWLSLSEKEYSSQK